jgi:hypothetical protein
VSKPQKGSRSFILLLLASCCLPAHGADRGYAAKATELLERPAAQAKAMAQLAKRQAVEIVGRNGSWANAKAGAVTGWVRLADLRLDAAPAKSPASAPPSAGKKDTGIRGFSEEELLVGAPNQAESERLKRVGVTVRDAVNFARAANLRSRQQDYIQMQEYMPEGGFPPGFFDE